MRRTKYRNVPTRIDGIRFASKAEARRYQHLKLVQAAGRIHNLRLQPRYPIMVKGALVCTYVADFSYSEIPSGRYVVEDVKGVRTAIYRLKAKLMQAANGITITEVGKAKR